MDVTECDISSVKLIRPHRFSDPRGYFVETWNLRRYREAGVDADFVQDNAASSRKAGTIRGLHFQRPPAAQHKLISVLRGSILDVAVDLRRASPSFGRHVSATLTAAGGEQLFIPAGFAHGYCTLEPDTEVAYKVSSFYAPEYEGGILWNDPDLGIAWPDLGLDPILSDKDRDLPKFRNSGAF